jgi:hypothetical protein
MAECRLSASNPAINPLAAAPAKPIGTARCASINGHRAHGNCDTSMELPCRPLCLIVQSPLLLASDGGGGRGPLAPIRPNAATLCGALWRPTHADLTTSSLSFRCIESIHQQLRHYAPDGTEPPRTLNSPFPVFQFVSSPARQAPPHHAVGQGLGQGHWAVRTC